MPKFKVAFEATVVNRKYKDMLISEIIKTIEEFAPLAYQESYDNAGLCVGNRQAEARGALLCLDVTEDVVREAIDKNVNLIISHHPIIFSGLKQITGSTTTERIVQLAVKHDIALYAAHTNLDSVRGGVSEKMCDKLGLKNRRILQPTKNQLVKIAVFAPSTHANDVRKAMFTAGAGHIGEYDSCSFNTQGSGTFRASAAATPFVGKVGELHHEVEEKIEVVTHESKVSGIVAAMRVAHPYEEVAYDLIPLLNELPNVGLGMTGELDKPMAINDFLLLVKNGFGASTIKYTTSFKSTIYTVSVCGGSGGSLINKAIASGADAFITGDLKYHQLQEASGRIVLVDVGHYESEIAAVDIFYEVITKKIPNFAAYLSSVANNPISYL